MPDLAAPGDLGWALCTPDLELYAECTDNAGRPAPIQDFGGTSQSSPLVAGAAALVIQAYESTHGGVRPTPALVKRLLDEHRDRPGTPGVRAGRRPAQLAGGGPGGRELARRQRQAGPRRQRPGGRQDPAAAQRPPGPAGARGRDGHEHQRKTVQLVKASTRSFEDVVATTSGTATLNTATAPAYVDAFGIARSYVSRTFTVGKADRLDVSEAATTAPAASRIILIDPSGAYAAYSIPQGAAQLRPRGRPITADRHLDGVLRPVQEQRVQRDHRLLGDPDRHHDPRHGHARATAMLEPGPPGTFIVHAKLPSQPSDLSASVQLSGTSGGSRPRCR